MRELHKCAKCGQRSAVLRQDGSWYCMRRLCGAVGAAPAGRRWWIEVSHDARVWERVVGFDVRMEARQYADELRVQLERTAPAGCRWFVRVRGELLRGEKVAV